jgi:predicted RNA binding protein YcfA (HicA-like mRNA interferase family)
MLPVTLVKSADHLKRVGGGKVMLHHVRTVRRSGTAANAVLRHPVPAAAQARAGATDSAGPYSSNMAKAARILAALRRDGWVETRRSGSHRVLVKGDQQRIWAYHDGVDLGGPALARIARDYGYTLDELRKL